MRTREGGGGFFDGLIDLFKTPFMSGVAVAICLGVTGVTIVSIAEEHRSSQEICVDSGGNWHKDLYNGDEKCELP